MARLDFATLARPCPLLFLVDMVLRSVVFVFRGELCMCFYHNAKFRLWALSCVDKEELRIIILTHNGSHALFHLN